jgi:hypothetical protein
MKMNVEFLSVRLLRFVLFLPPCPGVPRIARRLTFPLFRVGMFLTRRSLDDFLPLLMALFIHNNDLRYHHSSKGSAAQ